MSKPIGSDERYMRRALELAKRAEGRTNPNPMVGAVLVKHGRVIGEGYHRRAGAPHAEIEALRVARGSARGATLYVTLEPCRHWGKTPPCVAAIKNAGIRRVVYASPDPDPAHGGGGRILKRAGIAVRSGLLDEEAERLNEAWMVSQKKHRPFVAVKFAASLDGKIATRTGDSKWISSKEARAFTRSLRGTYQAIIVGIGTVLADDPHLGARERGRRDPLRVVLDKKLRIPLRAKVLRDKNVLVVTTAFATARKRRALEARGIPFLVMQGRRIGVGSLLKELYRREIQSVLVEGGSSVFGSFLDGKYIDKVYAAHAPLLIGGEEAPSACKGRGASRLVNALRLKRVSYRQFGDTMLTIGYAIN